MAVCFIPMFNVNLDYHLFFFLYFGITALRLVQKESGRARVLVQWGGHLLACSSPGVHCQHPKLSSESRQE